MANLELNILSMNSTTSLLGLHRKTVEELQNSHASRVLMLMNEHRKSCSKLCDVELTTSDLKISAHRSVLSACSPYFLAMFNGELIESKQKIIQMRDVQSDMLELLVDFAYTGNLDVNEDNAQPLLSTASQINFPEVREICCKFLETQLDSNNCLGIRNFGETHGCMRFLEEVDKFVIDHFSEVTQSEEFNLMCHELLLKCLASDELKINNEKEVYESVLKWVKFDSNGRGHLLTQLLKHIRMPLLPVKYLLEEVDKEPLIRTNHERRDLLDEAKNYHLLPDQHVNFRCERTIPRKSTVGTLFAVGGKEAGETITTKVECFSTRTNQWESITPLNVPRHQLGVAELNGHLYAVGGSDGVVRLETVEVYNRRSDEWKYVKSMNTCRSGVGVCTAGGALFGFGGYNGRICLNSVERYDPDADVWHYVAPMNVTRSFPGVAVLGGRIYSVGGNDGSSFLSSCEVFDPLANKWSFVAPMNKPRAGLGADILDGVLYVAGGFDGLSRLDSVEMYDPRMNAWLIVSSMQSCRDGLSMKQYGGWLYAVGGIDGPSYLNSVEYYDPKQDKWQEIIQMKSSRAAAGVAVLPNLFEIEPRGSGRERNARFYWPNLCLVSLIRSEREQNCIFQDFIGIDWMILWIGILPVVEYIQEERNARIGR
eukprot:gene9247-10224_t